MGKYDDIINMDRPQSKRPRMSVADRAKIFMPFAALKGYEAAIADMQRFVEGEVEREVIKIEEE